MMPSDVYSEGQFSFSRISLESLKSLKSFTQKVKLIFDMFFRHLKCIIRVHGFVRFFKGLRSNGMKRKRLL